MQDKFIQMVYKDLILLAFGFLHLGLIVLIELPLNLIKELHGFHLVFGNCHTRCKVGCKRILFYDRNWMTDFT